MLVAQVEDKAELTMLGGYMKILLLTIIIMFILLTLHTEDLPLRIIAQFLKNIIPKKQLHITQVDVLRKEMADIAPIFFIMTRHMEEQIIQVKN